MCVCGACVVCVCVLCVYVGLRCAPAAFYIEAAYKKVVYQMRCLCLVCVLSVHASYAGSNLIHPPTHPPLPYPQAPITWEWGMIAACCVAFVLSAEAYKAWARPLIARSERAALKRIKRARQGVVVSDGLEFVVVASGGKKREQELDESDHASAASSPTRAHAVAVATATAVPTQQQQGKALDAGAKGTTFMSAQ